MNLLIPIQRNILAFLINIIGEISE